METRKKFGLAAVCIFAIGFFYFLYHDRPIMDIAEQKIQNTITSNTESSNIAENTTSSPSNPEDTTSAENTYTLAEITAHGTADNCWATINGKVYDLTSWVSRHPGGPDRIKNLCGTDGTEFFTRKHGKSNAAQNALALLYIGELK